MFINFPLFEELLQLPDYLSLLWQDLFEFLHFL